MKVIIDVDRQTVEDILVYEYADHRGELPESMTSPEIQAAIVNHYRHVSAHRIYYMDADGRLPKVREWAARMIKKARVRN